jgi:hypothetical protein
MDSVSEEPTRCAFLAQFTIFQLATVEAVKRLQLLSYILLQHIVFYEYVPNAYSYK